MTVDKMNRLNDEVGTIIILNMFHNAFCYSLHSHDIVTETYSTNNFSCWVGIGIQKKYSEIFTLQLNIIILYICKVYYFNSIIYTYKKVFNCLNWIISCFEYSTLHSDISFL